MVPGEGFGRGLMHMLVVGTICTVIVVVALGGLLFWGIWEAVEHLRWVD